MFKDWDIAIKGCVQNNDVPTLACIPAVFANLISALLMFVGLFSLIIFITGGFELIHSGGEAKKLGTARMRFIFGTVGLLIVLLSFAIINIIAHVTGVECIKTFGFGCK